MLSKECVFLLNYIRQNAGDEYLIRLFQHPLHQRLIEKAYVFKSAYHSKHTKKAG